MSQPSGPRESQLLELIDIFLNARRTGQPITELPPALEPQNPGEVAYVQDAMAASFGEVGGWKIGAATPEASPAFAPMPAAWITPGGTLLRGLTHRFRGTEAEVAFLLGHDVPPRPTPYTLDEVLSAVASCHPAIEVLESAILDPTTVPRLAFLSDMHLHGGFVYGPACTGWQSVDFTKETATLAIDGSVRVERTGSNPAGDFLRLLPYLANEGAARAGGLRAGQWITTGSWTGNTLASAASTIDVRFTTLGRVTTRFA